MYLISPALVLLLCSASWADWRRVFGWSPWCARCSEQQRASVRSVDGAPFLDSALTVVTDDVSGAVDAAQVKALAKAELQQRLMHNWGTKLVGVAVLLLLSAGIQGLIFSAHYPDNRPNCTLHSSPLFSPDWTLALPI